VVMMLLLLLMTMMILMMMMLNNMCAPSAPFVKVTSVGLSSTRAVLDSYVYLVTEQHLTCGSCTSCVGGFFLGFEGVFTPQVH
jgi:hypothetical protein